MTFKGVLLECSLSCFDLHTLHSGSAALYVNSTKLSYTSRATEYTGANASSGRIGNKSPPRNGVSSAKLTGST